MATTYDGWVSSGRPSRQCRPGADLMHTLKGHGFTVYWMGDQSHLKASPPEDHTPFSHTPWPGSQPYPAVLAIDVMPGGSMDWKQLGARLVADKNNGVPATAAIKYINWTDSSGKCWHDSWQPSHARKSSSDTGHIHISFRTDYVDSAVMAGYDPVTGSSAQPPGGGGLTAPAWGGHEFRLQSPQYHSDAVRSWQARMQQRGWTIGVDGSYGPQSESVCRKFQQDSTDHGWQLSVDGVVGPNTWRASWERPVS